MSIGIILIAGLLSALIARSESGATRPHIVLILADDLGFDDVSFRGSNEFLTPNIDALGYHGTILNRFYGAALSTPSRAALLTGLYPIHSGTQYSTLGNGALGALPTNLTLMSELFQRAGYSTNLIGKWNLGHARKEYTPTYRGFDNHFGYWGSNIDHFQRRGKASPPCNHSIGFDFRRNISLDCSRLGTYVTDLFTEEAEEIISQHGNENGKPLFLMISHALPHIPLQAPQDELLKFSYIKDPARRTYAAMVSILDRSIGRVIRSLERANILANSIIIFSSDNGAAVVGQSRNAGSNWPLRGQKDSPWEGGLRLPAVIWSPLTARQRVFLQSVYIGDWLPTLATAAGITQPPLQTVDGQNLWPALLASNQEDNQQQYQRAILHGLDPKRHFVSYMRGPWKYINATTHNGNYDNVLNYREIYDVDPRAQRYVVEVRNSMVSKALSKFDVQRLTQHRIESTRQAASIRCGKLQRGCNALLEECLFNIETDPCEMNNLRYEERHSETLRALRAEVQKLSESAVQPIEVSCSRVEESDPALRDCTWNNFLDEAANLERRSCTSEGHPCGRVDKV